MTQQVYISDTNIWIDFRNAGLLGALFALPFELCSTDFVLNELEDFDPAALVEQGLVVHALDETATARLFDLMDAHNNSSLADVSCYLLAQDTGHPLLTGDGRLRKQATQDGIQVYGVLWLLDQLVACEIINGLAAANGLKAMLGNGARLPHAECQTRLRAWLV
ncbi:PIN_VapC-like domain containing protein [Comamonadaceae bacterium]